MFTSQMQSTSQIIPVSQYMISYINGEVKTAENASRPNLLNILRTYNNNSKEEEVHTICKMYGECVSSVDLAGIQPYAGYVAEAWLILLAGVLRYIQPLSSALYAQFKSSLVDNIGHPHSSN